MEIKEITDYLGMGEIKTVDEFKSAFDKEFLRSSAINDDSEPVKKILNRVYGTFENEIKKVAKKNDLDIDFDSSEIKDKRYFEKLRITLDKYDEKKSFTIKELEAKAGQGNDEKVKEWETKYEKLNKKFADTDNLLKQTSTDFEGYKATSAKDLKNVKINIHKADIFGKAKFLPDVNEYAKKGFLNEFEEKYSLDLDENEKVIVTDKKGQRIPNPKVTGSFFEPLDLLTEETIKAKLYPLNKDAGKPAPANQFQQKQPAQTINNNQRVVAKRL